MAKAIVAETGGRDTYRDELAGRPDVPLWQQPWWLDATAGDGWDAVCLHEGGRVVAALPYVPKRRLGLTAWAQPPLTQSLGPWLSEQPASYERRLSREHALLEALVECIPNNIVYVQNWQCSTSNWMPFYWAGYAQTTRYTYRLDLSKPESQLRAELSKKTRWSVKTAQDRFGITASRTTAVDDLLRLNEAAFRRQDLAAPYPSALVHRVFAAGETLGAAEVWIAHDQEGRAAAGALIVRDAQSAYYLIGGADPNLRATGAQNLVVWEAIRGQIGQASTFDFEGSMIRAIEHSFRTFGATQVPYFAVSGSKKSALHLASLGSQWMKRQQSAAAPAKKSEAPVA